MYAVFAVEAKSRDTGPVVWACGICGNNLLDFRTKPPRRPHYSWC
jgi:hypothetical protein